MTHSLIRMAADGSSAGRRGLLQATTDWYLSEQDPGATLQDHYAFIATQALRRLPHQDRAAYARRVAAAPTLPRPVVWSLATDRAMTVAHPVLKLSPVLTEDDLAALAVTQTHEHRISIATRATLGPMITDLLADLGNLKVLRQVSRNAGAEFSEQGIARLMDRAGADAEVARNLAERALQRPERRAETVLHLAAAARPEPTEALRPAREVRPEVEDLIADITAGRRNLDEVVLMLIEQDQAFEVAAVLGTFSRQPARQVLATLFRPEADDIARLCGSIDLSGDIVGALLALRAKRLALTPSQVARERQRFEAADHRGERSAAPRRPNLFFATA